jgi:MoxR-like ATPase
LEIVQKAKDLVHEIEVDDKIKDISFDSFFATRQPEEYGLNELKSLISVGGSPRATTNRTLPQKAYAYYCRAEVLVNLKKKK